MSFKQKAVFVILAAFLIVTSSYAASSGEGYVKGVLLVRFADDLTFDSSKDGFLVTFYGGIDRLFKRFKASEVQDIFGGYIPKDEEYRYKIRNDYKIIFPLETDMDLVSSEFVSLPSVLEACPNSKYPVDYIPNDPSYSSQYWLSKIDAPDAWEIATGSEEVIVVAIDTGTDWNHPDLIENIWVNPGEDLDENHWPYDEALGFDDEPGTAGDWNNIDDDNNGLVDDILGWDWVTATDVAAGEDGFPMDNNPMDFDGHGTGVASAMASPANNETGGASVAFNCRIMPSRAGYLDAATERGVVVSASAAAAIIYATDKGAKIINMSYGSATPRFETRNALEYAWDHGLLLFGATGNDNVSTIQYPANYPNVISVGATDQSDNRADFSNYGNWVDVSAPGVACYTAWFNDSYQSWDGTSVASPIAAGIGALLASHFPDRTNAELSQFIINTTDEIETDQPLGSGRVNAYNALTMLVWPELTVTEWHFSDPDGNGHPDINEEIEVYLNLSNREGWQDATNVTARIEFDIDGVDYGQQEITLGNIGNGEEIDNNGSPLRFTILPGNHDGHFANFSISITSEPNEYETGESARVMVGTPDILVVDDDGGDQLENYVLDVLDNNRLDYFCHDASILTGTLSDNYLSTYDAVLWFGGNAENPLSETDIQGLQGAMDNGVNVFLYGETFDEQLTGTDFYSDYLHAQSAEGTTGIAVQAAQGAEGPILPESQMILLGPGGAGNSTNPDVIIPVNGAIAAYNYFQTESCGGIYYADDTRKLVYFAFAFEAVSGASGSVSRNQALSEILYWFDVLDVDEDYQQTTVPSDYSLETIYPNPFNNITTIRVNLPQASPLQVGVFNMLGRQVVTLASGMTPAGIKEISWDAAGLSSGIYFVQASVPGKMKEIRKVILLK